MSLSLTVKHPRVHQRMKLNSITISYYFKDLGEQTLSGDYLTRMNQIDTLPIVEWMGLEPISPFYQKDEIVIYTTLLRTNDHNLFLLYQLSYHSEWRVQDSDLRHYLDRMELFSTPCYQEQTRTIFKCPNH